MKRIKFLGDKKQLHKVEKIPLNNETPRRRFQQIYIVSVKICIPSFSDPTIKDHVREYLTTTSNNHHQQDISSYSSTPTPASPVINTNSSGRGHRISSSDSSACRKSRIPVNHTRVSSISAPQSPQTVKPRYQSHIPTANGVSPIVQKKQQPYFEAYMMTGDLILNLSRTPQSSGLLPAQAKKVDSLRDSPIRSLKRKNGTAPKAIYDSSPSEASSPSLSDIAAHQENVESNNNNNRKNSKLSKVMASGDSRLNSIDSSVDEEEEQLIMEHGSSSNDPSTGDGRKMKFNLINSGCVNNTSSSSSSGSSPTNTNSSNSSPNMHENYDGGGSDNDPVGLSRDAQKNQKYSVLENEEQQQQQKQQLLIQQDRKHLNVTPSASMSSTTTTSSASTTINRSETLHTPTPDVSHSMPTSPTSLSTPLLDVAKRRELASSVPTSPECNQQDVRRSSSNSHHQQQNGICVRKNDASGFRTSRSEDHLQHSQREGAMGNAIPIDIDEDVNSSLNTLLDTRHDSEDSQSSDRDRIVWTYNAPVVQSQGSSNHHGVVVSPTSNSSSISTSPQHSDSPVSPTSVSSSVMSSSGSKGNGLSHTANGGIHGLMIISGEQSVSEAISNISSPDYQDEHDLLSARDLSAAMAISDPSDSDSTLIVDNLHSDKDHKVVIQVSSIETYKSSDALKDSEDELATLAEESMSTVLGNPRDSSPPVSDDGSDVESLHSFHYSPKAVDIPSAIRLAKRLHGLEGFKKSDVSRHLSKK